MTAAVSSPLLAIGLRDEHDVVLTRQRSRQLAALLGFEPQDQTRIATAVSELARNALQYAHGGRVEFDLASRPDAAAALRVCVCDNGPGIVDVNAVTGKGVGLIGARRLMDTFVLESSPSGTRVVTEKWLPRRRPGELVPDVAWIAGELAQRGEQNPFEEIRQQNQELLRALDAVRARETELAQVNRELNETNRGVVALYAELDEKAHALARVSEHKTRFLSDISHEFRTPLSSILSLSRLLLDHVDGDLTPEQEKQVTFIQTSAQSLSTLVNDLLDLAKIEAGKISVRPETFSVVDLFGALRGMFRPLVPAGPDAPVALHFDFPAANDTFPPLTTDQGKLAQILRNFIGNALKFSHQGTVRVSAALAASGDQITFGVADLGIGIAPSDLERVFDEFVQIEGALQARVKGTGLGLSLSRRLARLLGGDVVVQSTPGVGSTFSVTIPICYPEPDEARDAN